jgi:hypothetical protein
VSFHHVGMYCNNSQEPTVSVAVSYGPTYLLGSMVRANGRFFFFFFEPGFLCVALAVLELTL